jgi:hypothetical protein
MHIYNWYHSITAGIHLHIRTQLYIHGTFPLASCFLLLPFSPISVPFYLLGTLLAVTGSVHVALGLLANKPFHFPPLAHIPLIPKSRPPEFPNPKYTFIRTAMRTWLTRSSTDSTVDLSSYGSTATG